MARQFLPVFCAESRPVTRRSRRFLANDAKRADQTCRDRRPDRRLPTTCSITRCFECDEVATAEMAERGCLGTATSGAALERACGQLGENERKCRLCSPSPSLGFLPFTRSLLPATLSPRALALTSKALSPAKQVSATLAHS
ncbi:hypothetical protein BMF94_5267 [Rhodotorula taiwanensis]|uniref:Uncharacterized protein n=1 Tax=Rhodotorula taiwanensis TaxID=741276 RepID=A0A2S5B4K6_9BASI|nr:hypothetical protein BMF94_5267 [Rhodotorula taiwanensis]